MWGLGAGIGVAGDAMQAGDSAALDRAAKQQALQQQANQTQLQQENNRQALQDMQSAEAARQAAVASGGQQIASGATISQGGAAPAPQYPAGNNPGESAVKPSAPATSGFRGDATLAAQMKSRAAAQAELDALRNRPQAQRDNEALRHVGATAADVATMPARGYGMMIEGVAHGARRVIGALTGKEQPPLNGPNDVSAIGSGTAPFTDSSDWRKNKDREAELLDQLKFHDENIATLQKKKAAFEKQGVITGFATQHQVDPRLALAIFGQETSSGKNTNDSAKGAVGPMQIMPGTFDQVKALGLIPKEYDIRNPAQAAEAGVAYLGFLQRTLKTNDPSVLAQAYFSGPGGVGQNRSDGRVSTNDYASQVLARMNALPQASQPGQVAQVAQPAQLGQPTQAQGANYGAAQSDFQSGRDPWWQQLDQQKNYATMRMQQLASAKIATPEMRAEMNQLRQQLPMFQIADYQRQIEQLSIAASQGRPEALANLGATYGSAMKLGPTQVHQVAPGQFILRDSQGNSVFGQPMSAQALASNMRTGVDKGLHDSIIAMQVEIAHKGALAAAEQLPKTQGELAKVAMQGDQTYQLRQLMGSQDFLIEQMKKGYDLQKMDFKPEPNGTGFVAMDASGKNGVHIAIDPKGNTVATPITYAQFASVPGKATPFQQWQAGAGQSAPVVSGQVAAPQTPGVQTNGAGFLAHNVAAAHRTGAFAQ